MSKTAVFYVAVCVTTVYSQHCKWYLKNFRRSRLKIFLSSTGLALFEKIIFSACPKF